MSYVVQKQNPYHQDPYQVTETVTVEPEETTKATSYSMPTDPELLRQIEREKQSIQRAYGIDPNKGTPTPFEVLGYNPEDERKRREAERALNDRKRKENAWYNAFAVLGDSLTAALGGNVWQRQPNRIGEKANADNARLIAEQKAEDEANRVKLRSANAQYADAVNKLLQNYLIKTTTTNKTGGGRLKITDHPAIDGYKTSSHVVGAGSKGSGGSGGGAGSRKYINVDIKDGSGNVIKRNRYDVTTAQYQALQGILKEHYNKILSRGDALSADLERKLRDAHVITGTDTNGQFIYDEDQLVQNGKYWALDEPTMERIERETDGKVKFKRNSATTWQGVDSEEAEEEEYDD